MPMGTFLRDYSIYHLKHEYMRYILLIFSVNETIHIKKPMDSLLVISTSIKLPFAHYILDPAKEVLKGAIAVALLQLVTYDEPPQLPS